MVFPLYLLFFVGARNIHNKNRLVYIFFWTNIGKLKNIGIIWEHVGKIVEKYRNNIGRILVKCWKNIGKILEKYWKSIGKILEKYWKSIGKILE